MAAEKLDGQSRPPPTRGPQKDQKGNMEVKQRLQRPEKKMMW